MKSLKSNLLTQLNEVAIWYFEDLKAFNELLEKIDSTVFAISLTVGLCQILAKVFKHTKSLLEVNRKK